METTNPNLLTTRGEPVIAGIDPIRDRLLVVPARIRRFAAKKYEHMTPEAGKKYVEKILDRTHKTDSDVFHSQKNLSRNLQPRVQNSWIADLDDGEVNITATGEFRRQFWVAKKIDEANKKKEDEDWRINLEHATKDQNIEFVLSLDWGQIDHVRYKKRIDEMPTEKQLRRRLKKIRARTYQEFYLAAEMIGKNKKFQVAGAQNVEIKKSQDEKNKEWADNSTIVDPETGEILTLSQVQEHSRKKYGAELFAYIHGLDQIAKEDGLKGLFVVLTAPPKFHAMPRSGDSSKWDGSQPIDAHKFLLKKWKQIKDELRHDYEILLAGYRGPEAHDDATTHHNHCVFAKPEQIGIVREIIKKHFNWSDRAAVISPLDEKKGGIYALFYSLKFAFSDMKTDTPATAASRSWYSTNGIRKSQFYGVPARSTYRELRKLSDSPDPSNALASSQWRAARSGNAALYIRLQGGLNIKQASRPLRGKTETCAQVKTTIFEFWKQEIYRAEKKCWQLELRAKTKPTSLQAAPVGAEENAAPPSQPNKDGESPVIIKHTKEGQGQDQNQSQNPRFSDPEPPDRHKNRLH